MRGGCRTLEGREERSDCLGDADELCPLGFALCLVRDESGGRAERGQMQMESQQWKSSALLSVSSFVFLCTCSIISFSARLCHLSPHLLVSPSLLRTVFLLLSPPAPSLLSSLVSRGASW